MNGPQPADPLDLARERMVKEQLAERGIADPSVLAAMARVPRHLFIPEPRRQDGYEDQPVSIGYGQTISQPYMVALMLEQLQVRPGSKILEVGTGSGYQAAVLAEMDARVLSIERIPALADAAGEQLRRLGIRRVQLRVGDGSLGWPEEAPFDGIVVGACAPRIPTQLSSQLAEGGALVIPVGKGIGQEIWVLHRRRGRMEQRKVCGCIFVPLIGREGWEEGEMESEEAG